MRGSELSAIRTRLRMSEARFAQLLGYTGKPKNNQNRIMEYERGKKQIPLYIARLAWLIDAWIDAFGSVNFPSWEGYDFEHKPDEVMEHE
jgi:transcriptional regulator with XRE-family HTH domain